MYADKDPRVKCISINNCGANQARKRGVLEAIGDYIIFVDSDDTIAANTLTNMMSIMLRNPRVDVVVAHMEDQYKEVIGYNHLLDLLNGSCKVEMCFKMYKAGILKENFIDIPRSLIYGEDLLQNINIARYISLAVYCNFKYYNYRMVETSVCHTFTFSQEYENRYYDFLDMYLFDPSFIGKISSDLKSEIQLAYYRCRLNGLKNVLLFSANYNFYDGSFLRLKSELKLYASKLNADEKIFLYSPPILCTLFLKCYYSFNKIMKKLNFYR